MEEDEHDVKARLKDHANLARAAYQNNFDRVKSDIVWTNMFPYLNWFMLGLERSEVITTSYRSSNHKSWRVATSEII